MAVLIVTYCGKLIPNRIPSPTSLARGWLRNTIWGIDPLRFRSDHNFVWWNLLLRTRQRRPSHDSLNGSRSEEIPLLIGWLQHSVPIYFWYWFICPGLYCRILRIGSAKVMQSKITWQLKMGPVGYPETSVTTNSRYATSHKSEDRIHTAVEARNYVQKERKNRCKIS